MRTVNPTSNVSSRLGFFRSPNWAGTPAGTLEPSAPRRSTMGCSKRMSIEERNAWKSARSQRLAAAQAACDAASLPIPVTLSWHGRDTVNATMHDDAPGWRAKDRRVGEPNPRTALKSAINHALSEIGLQLTFLQSSYSCLQPRADGMIERRDDSGRVIGLHRP